MADLRSDIRKGGGASETDCGGAGRPALPNEQMNGTSNAQKKGSGNGISVGRDVPVAPNGKSWHGADGETDCGGAERSAMPSRKRLHHVAPLRVDTRNAAYFITICAANRHDADWTGFCHANERCDVAGETNRGGAGRPALPNGRMNAIPVGRDVPVAPNGGSVASEVALNGISVGRDVPVAPNGEGCANQCSPPAVHLIDSARHYHSIGKWFLHLILIMPDHLHMIVTLLAYDGVGGIDRGGARRPALPNVQMNGISVGRDVPVAPNCGCVASEVALNGIPVGRDVPIAPLLKAIVRWKAYVSRMFGIRFQRDFWDTRIRDTVHFLERYEYVLYNPVRKGFVSEVDSWPWKWDCRDEMAVKCDLDGETNCGGASETDRGGAGRPALPNGRMNAIPVGRDVPIAPNGGCVASEVALNGISVGRDVPVAPNTKEEDWQ